MKLQTKNNNYCATIVEIKNLAPIEKLNALVGTNIFANRVLVSKDTQIGDIGIFFPVECQINHDFLKVNNLYRLPENNVDVNKKGFFDLNRRVRAQKFVGEKSSGFWIPIESLFIFLDSKNIKYNKSEFVDGLDFDIIDNIVFTQKYIVKIDKQKGLGGGDGKTKPKRISKLIENQFRFHFDTAQLGKNIHRISPDDVIVVDVKKHGTSSVTANLLVKRPLKWYEKVLDRIGVMIDKVQYDYLYSSRKVIKNDALFEHNHYYKYDLWKEAGEKYFKDKLHSGESVYYEILGFTKDGGYIQKGFDYKCNPNEYKIEVYRITQTNVDGKVIELQWNQLKHRCQEMGVNHVEELYYGKAKYMYPQLSLDNHWHENFLNKLREDYLEKWQVYNNNNVPEEGIVVRKEGYEIECFKLKSFAFLKYETDNLDKGEVDMESEESTQSDNDYPDNSIVEYN
jgi:hypothetical protein